MGIKEHLHRWLRKTRDVLALILLLLIYHGVEALCYVISNLFPYYQAVPIYASCLLVIALGLIGVHDYLRRRFHWDALSLHYVNSLSHDETIQPYQIYKRAIRFILRKGFWVIFLIGPVLLGPFVATILLRKRRNWTVNIAYTICGAFFNALFWVAFMAGLGAFTWQFLTGGNWWPPKI
jgi:hypothetical protein